MDTQTLLFSESIQICSTTKGYTFIDSKRTMQDVVVGSFVGAL